MNNQERIDKLCSALTEHNRLYRLGTPSISDKEYDSMVNELCSLDPDNAWFKTIEPATISQSRKRKLPIPMKSLNKAKSLAEVFRWLKSLGVPDTAKVVVTPKFDGVSWLHSEILGETFSRGGSENEGQDCTPHYNTGSFNNIYQWGWIPRPRFTFGELVFSRKNWEEYFKGQVSPYTGDKYRSPRNTIAGLINRDEASDLIKHATFFRYGVGQDDLENFDTYTELYDILCSKYNQPTLKKTLPVEALNEEDLSDLFSNWSALYYIDGLVIYLDDLNLWKTIGRHQATGNPLYVIAYKHPDFTESFETTVTGIEWNVSKSGALKPVVKIEAIDTGDCVMDSPTGNNARWCMNHGIGKYAKIRVTRSGGVIPKILGVLEGSKTELPIFCPVCGAITVFNNSGVELCCLNPDCRGRRLAKAVHFFKTVGAENIGEETLAKIIAEDYLSISDILNIKPDALYRIPTFGDSTVNTLLQEFKKIKEGVDLATLIHASDCFMGIGQIKAQKFLDSLSTEEMDAFVNGTFLKLPHIKEAMENISDLSVTTANILLGYISFIDFLESTQIPYIRNLKVEPTGSKCKGLKVCFSGIRDKELESIIISEGGEVVGGVSKKTTHLIVKDPTSSSSKITNAVKLNIPVMTIDEFKTQVF